MRLVGTNYMISPSCGKWGAAPIPGRVSPARRVGTVTTRPDEERDAGGGGEFESDLDVDPLADADDERLLRDVPPHHGS